MDADDSHRNVMAALTYSNHRGSKSLQIVYIMLAVVSIWLLVKYSDAQVGYKEVIALFCRGSPVGFAAVLQILCKFTD